MAWGDSLLAGLSRKARARFRAGRFVSCADGVAIFALPGATHRDFCEPFRSEVEDALSAHFGLRVPLRLAVDEPSKSPGPAAARRAPDEEAMDEVDIAQTVAAPEEDRGAADIRARIMAAFPGAEEVEE